MSLGRIGWACFAGYVTSAWPCLFANTACCVLSAMCMFIPSQALLWSSAMGVGVAIQRLEPLAIYSQPGVPRFAARNRDTSHGRACLC